MIERIAWEGKSHVTIIKLRKKTYHKKTYNYGIHPARKDLGGNRGEQEWLRAQPTFSFLGSSHQTSNSPGWEAGNREPFGAGGDTDPFPVPNITTVCLEMKRTDYTAKSKAWQYTPAGGTSLAEGVGNTRTGPDSDTWPLASWELVPSADHTQSRRPLHIRDHRQSWEHCVSCKRTPNPPPQIHRTATSTDRSQPCSIPPTSKYGWRCPPPQRALTVLSPWQHLQLRCTGLPPAATPQLSACPHVLHSMWLSWSLTLGTVGEPPSSEASAQAVDQNSLICREWSL